MAEEEKKSVTMDAEAAAKMDANGDGHTIQIKYVKLPN